jgi:hypothetical protein
MLEDDIFQVPHFFFEAVELGEEELFLFGFVAQSALDLFVFALLAFATFVGCDAVAFKVLCPIGTNGSVSCRSHVGRGVGAVFGVPEGG